MDSTPYDYAQGRPIGGMTSWEEFGKVGNPYYLRVLLDSFPFDYAQGRPFDGMTSGENSAA